MTKKTKRAASRRKGQGLPTITIDVQNAEPIRFRGEIVTEVAGEPELLEAIDPIDGHRVHTETRVLRLYRTDGGHLVGAEIRVIAGRTPATEAREIVLRADHAIEPSEFFGFTDLAKRLYAAAGIDVARDVD